MREAKGTLLVAVLFTLIGWLQAESPMAQDDARKALVGAWEGTVTQGSASAPTLLVFSVQGDKLAWKWTWEASFGKGEAEGTVTKYSAPSLELSGAYTFHPSLRTQGSPITMALTVTGNQMQGDGLTVKVNVPFRLSVSKK